MGKVLYLNDGADRQSQIASWFVDEVRGVNLQGTLTQIKGLLQSPSEQDNNLAVRGFRNLMFTINLSLIHI